MQCPFCCPQPCGSTTPWHCSSVWVWMCSGAIYLLTATTKRTRTVIKTPWLRPGPFRRWRGPCTLWMNSRQIIGTFMAGVWYSASKSGRTVTICRAQPGRRTLTVHYPAVHSPSLDKCAGKCGVANKTPVLLFSFVLFIWLSAWNMNVIITKLQSVELQQLIN